ncbi:Got1 family protein [Ascobolus immersus RN42]|uniref:Got1 family protein n=1 Tax=Ascobolus immersus RN42 TaxID=1160509 RepID=A0A3N4I0X8_ASCIM|nr:Got1 family protein [Ascobolus immersus RN42]
MWLSDQQKIGAAFCSGGGFFFIFGIMMFFDRSMLAMGNILFLIGLTLLLGPRKTLTFFASKEKLKGTAFFAVGILTILLRYPLIGFCLELYGILCLFGDFFGVIAGVVRAVPVVGGYLAWPLERLGGGGPTLPV